MRTGLEILEKHGGGSNGSEGSRGSSGRRRDATGNRRASHQFRPSEDSMFSALRKKCRACRYFPCLSK
jgi:hypothetical protein